MLKPGPSQLAAAVVALVSTLVARARDSSGLLWLVWQASFAHWALEACVIAEAERLTGAWATRLRFKVQAGALVLRCDACDRHELKLRALPVAYCMSCPGD